MPTASLSRHRQAGALASAPRRNRSRAGAAGNHHRRHHRAAGVFSAAGTRYPFLVRDALDQGLLQTVLDDYLDRTVTFWMLWPASRYASPKLRVFIDHMSQHLRI